MVLSETEAEAQLASLRRQRETLDRAIADLSLYLELGRRLTTGPVLSGEVVPTPAPPAPSSQPGLRPSPDLAERAEAPDRDAFRQTHQADREQPLVTTPASGRHESEAIPRGSDSRVAAAAPIQSEINAVGRGPGDPVSTDGVLSESVLARRYGRALIEAALAALEEAGRPLHAGEILAVLTARGFSLPGHDPVAALNTRLWKRSGSGGPLKRMGDAVYALAEPEDEIRSDPVFR